MWQLRGKRSNAQEYLPEDLSSLGVDYSELPGETGPRVGKTVFSPANARHVLSECLARGINIIVREITEWNRTPRGWTMKNPGKSVVWDDENLAEGSSSTNLTAAVHYLDLFYEDSDSSTTMLELWLSKPH